MYVFNQNDTNAPSGLLTQLLIVNGQAPTTTTPAPAPVTARHESVTPTTASAVVLTRLVISNSSLIPCESLVNSTIKALLTSRAAKLPDSVTVMNYTYERKVFFLLHNIPLTVQITVLSFWTWQLDQAGQTINLLSSPGIPDSSYAVNITFKMSSIKIHGKSACMNSTEENVKTSINRAVSTQPTACSAYSFYYCWHWFMYHRHNSNLVIN